MLAKLLCTKRKSASAPRCLRCLGATIDIVNSITRTANRSGQGGIFASMFTKGQHRGHGDHWAWRLTGNYWTFLTAPRDEEFEGQHFDRKEVGEITATADVLRKQVRGVIGHITECVSAFANRNLHGGLLST